MGGGTSKRYEGPAPEELGKKTAGDKRLTELEGGKFAIFNEVELGRGAYSIVKLGLHRPTPSTQEEVAVKCIDGSRLKPRDRKALDEEVRIMRSLNHPNIVRMLADIKGEDEQYFIVMEKVEGGELFDRVVELEAYNEEQARATSVVLLDALQYLHGQSIVHRDLKPENLLLKSKDTNSDIKIADFGFATQVTGPSCLTDMCGTPGYVAPEVIRMGSRGGTPYGLPCDMWSVGVIIFVLLGGYPPFDHDDQKVLFELISTATYEFHSDFWSEISDAAKDLISKLLVVDPAKRMTAAEALEHPWLQLSEADLQSRNLGKNQAAMKRWNHRRKLKKVFHTVMAANRMTRLLGGLKKAAAIEIEAQKAEAEAAASTALVEIAENN